MESRGLPVRIDSIRQIVNLLLQKRSTARQDNLDPVTVGQR
jgi:hypothetical protein